MPVPVDPVPIVVIHRNRVERLRATVAALTTQTVPVRVVLVDSGSTHEAHAAAVAMLPADSVVVRLGVNGGFGPSANAGWRVALADVASSADWIGLCPHDAIAEPDAVERILAAVADRPRAGLACADFGDGATPVVDPYFGGIQIPAGTDDGWDPAGYPHGTLLFTRKAFLDDVGLFDERYFAYCEEADLGLRAHAAGWEVGLVRGARVRNPDMSTTAAAVDYLMLRNTLLLVREHSGRYHAVIRSLIAVGQLVTHRATNPYYDLRARLYALRDAALGRYGPPPVAL